MFLSPGDRAGLGPVSNRVLREFQFDNSKNEYIFAGIAPIYSKLELNIVARSSESNVNAIEAFSINGDASAMYDAQIIFGSAGAAASSGQDNGQVYVNVGGINGDNITDTAELGFSHIEFLNPFDTQNYKLGWFQSRRNNTVGTHQSYVISGSFQIRTLAPIYAIRIYLAPTFTWKRGRAILRGIL